jgi:hypothetical protein
VAQALRAILRDEVPAAIEPIVASVVRIQWDRGNFRVGLALVGATAGAVRWGSSRDGAPDATRGGFDRIDRMEALERDSDGSRRNNRDSSKLH